MTSKERLERVANYLEKSAAPDIADEIRKCLPDLEVLEIIKKHPYLNLSVLDDYDDNEYNEYFDNWNNTTNELDRKEFELLKEWLKDDN